MKPNYILRLTPIMGFIALKNYYNQQFMSFQDRKSSWDTIISKIFPAKGPLYMDMHQLINIFSNNDEICNELKHHCPNDMLSGPTKNPNNEFINYNSTAILFADSFNGSIA